MILAIRLTFVFTSMHQSKQIVILISCRSYCQQMLNFIIETQYTWSTMMGLGQLYQTCSVQHGRSFHNNILKLLRATAVRIERTIKSKVQSIFFRFLFPCIIIFFSRCFTLITDIFILSIF